MNQLSLAFLPEASKLARQQALILDRLRKGPATSTELTGICLRYSARIFELRKAGHEIETKRQGDIATYTLKERP